MRRSFGATAGWSAVARSSWTNRRSPLCSTFRIFMAERTETMRQASRYTLRLVQVNGAAVPGRQNGTDFELITWNGNLFRDLGNPRHP